MRPPGSATFVDELLELRRQLDELRRRPARAPVCQVFPAGDTALPANTDVYASGTWSVRSDDEALFLPGSPAGVLIPADGRWLLRNRANIAVAAGEQMNTRIYLNGTGLANRVAIGNTGANPKGGRVTITAEREVVLTSSDVIYWSYWTSTAGTVYGGENGLQTEFMARYVGPA